MRSSVQTPSTSGRGQEQRHFSARLRTPSPCTAHPSICPTTPRPTPVAGARAVRQKRQLVNTAAVTSGRGDAGGNGGGGGVVLREVLTRPERVKLDTGDDSAFYDMPRFVKHVDADFLDQVTELYRQRIPEGGAVLDLCSSWVSHLPAEMYYTKVLGHGMNAAELARNQRFEAYFVRDLNQEPDGWPLADQGLDAVVCCVSVQYLQQPERVFAEIYRVLKPGGVCIVTFSNRMFYTKLALQAIAAWRDASGFARCQLVRQYFQAVSGFTAPEVLTAVNRPADQQQQGRAGGGGFLKGLLDSPLARLFRRSSSDPFYAVVAYRNFRREL
ncbi:hypothetical protein VaNZ11_003874 [Volvox africanus]|uniref:Methyltransferase type 11 domain-containing protein n=1 Tax=Volvox africanus TaxID=51714 RepID=A0ABQ5RWR0_9CHLO|nr:hypothetical protein VaNZ11_003874 [Volvox africanus]